MYRTDMIAFFFICNIIGTFIVLYIGSIYCIKMMVDGEGRWKVKQNSYGGKVAAFQLAHITETKTKYFFFSLGLARTSSSALNQSSTNPIHSVTLPTSTAFQVFFTWETL